MKIAVIIITYNNQRDVVHAIGSVQEQSYKNWQCVIIDNGSTDDTYRVITELLTGDSRFSSFQKLNEGPSAGRNFGYSKIDKDTEYVHFLDGDDMLSPNFLNAMVAFLDLHPHVGLLGCQYHIVNENGEFVSKGNRSRFEMGFLGFPKKLRNNKTHTPFESFFAATGQGAYAVFGTQVFNQTEGYDERFWRHEDSDIFCQMALLSEVHYIPEYLYKVRMRNNSLSHSKVKKPSNFRKKWDNYQCDNEEINNLIEKCLKYYYTRHKPLRDFKVGLKAMRNFFSTRDRHSFFWSLQCFNSGFIDLIFQRTYMNRIEQRKSINNGSQNT